MEGLAVSFHADEELLQQTDYLTPVLHACGRGGVLLTSRWRR